MADTERRIDMRSPHPAEALVGALLGGFEIKHYTEVYRTDVDGVKTTSLGYFEDEDVAVAFADSQSGSAYLKAENVLLLTDGKQAFLIGEAVQLMDDEQAALQVREAALKKLTPAERKLLRL